MLSNQEREYLGEAFLLLAKTRESLEKRQKSDVMARIKLDLLSAAIRTLEIL